MKWFIEFTFQDIDYFIGMVILILVVSFCLTRILRAILVSIFQRKHYEKEPKPNHHS